MNKLKDCKGKTKENKPCWYQAKWICKNCKGLFCGVHRMSHLCPKRDQQIIQDTNYPINLTDYFEKSKEWNYH